MKKSILAEVQNPTLPLVLYGAGMYAQYIFNILNDAGIEIHAVCVDDEFLKENGSTWNQLPVYSKAHLQQHFPVCNLIIGFYSLLQAKKITWADAHSIYFFDETQLLPLAQLDTLEAGMADFFNHVPSLLSQPNLIHLYLGSKKKNIVLSNYDVETGEIQLTTSSGTKIITNTYFGIFKEIFCDEVYLHCKDYISDDYVIFDIGANRGYSALYFAEDAHCKKIFSFEPTPATLTFLHKNIELNPEYKNKINVFEYGLSNINEEVTFYIPNDGTDGVNSTEIEFINTYYSSERRSNITETKIIVKNAAEVIAKLIQPQHVRKIIKIDIEGGEYKVLDSLKNAGILSQFHMIIGECHNGMDGIMNICGEDFDLIHCLKENTDTTSIFLLLKKG